VARGTIFPTSLPPPLILAGVGHHDTPSLTSLQRTGWIDARDWGVSRPFRT